MAILKISCSEERVTEIPRRNSRSQIFFKIGVLKKFAKLSCRQLLQLNLKKRLCHRCFPVNFAKFLRTPF